MASTPEGKVKTALDKMLKEEHVWFFPPQAGPYGRAGVPDRVLCLGGEFIAVEAKAGDNDLTALQKKCKGEIQEAGGAYFIVRSKEDIEALREYIRARRSRQKGPTPKSF